MQTFLPYESFTESARVLDYRRCGKQRVEAMQLLQALAGDSKGWANHPAARMWRGYEHTLGAYALIMCKEWIERGYKDTCTEKILALMDRFPKNENVPSFLGDEAFHASHRSNLLRKDPVYYGKFNWSETNDMPYIWPVN